METADTTVPSIVEFFVQAHHQQAHHQAEAEQRQRVPLFEAEDRERAQRRVRRKLARLFGLAQADTALPWDVRAFLAERDLVLAADLTCACGPFLISEAPGDPYDRLLILFTCPTCRDTKRWLARYPSDVGAQIVHHGRYCCWSGEAA